jgi:hypothetical protein
LAEQPKKQVVFDDLTLEINTGGGTLPVQIQGWVTYVDPARHEVVQLAFYSRERDGWSLDIAPPGMTIHALWEENQARRARGETELGYTHPDLDLQDMYLLIARHARRYRAELDRESEERGAEE